MGNRLVVRPFKNCLSFDGVDDYVDAGNGASLNITNAITYEIWIRYNGYIAGTNRFFLKGGAETSYEFYDGGDGNVNSVIVTSGNPAGIYTSIGTLTLNTWYHIMATYDGSNVRTYRNGVLINTVGGSGTISTDSGVLKIGNTFNGSIDEVRIYNRALTANEILASYYDNIHSTNGLVGYWNMNEGSGDTVADSSGNNNNGTRYGATWIINNSFSRERSFV